MNKYLSCLVNDIHTAVVATADENGLPVTAAIDMMDVDEEGVYFLTARGKSFYKRLKNRGVLALTGIKGSDTLHSKALSLQGKVKEIGSGALPRLFEKNPYMKEIYPTEASREALTVFVIWEGTGEWFDLSQKPIQRASFAFGSAKTAQEGYRINEKCIGCGKCREKCPQNCIDTAQIPFRIKGENCLHCGNCLTVCPVGAVEKRKENDAG